jgi:acetyl-CoA acetyltransferase
VPPGRSGNSTPLQDKSRPLDGKEQAVAGASNRLTARSALNGAQSCGFCKEAEALDFIRDGHIELYGELPLNTFGGSLGTGRIHGLWHIIEGALQASGRAGSRQVKDANVSFVGASAPIVTGTTFIFFGDPY